MRKSIVYTSKNENIVGLLYICLQMFILPSALALINSLLPTPLSVGAINFVFFAINFICVSVIFKRYFISSVRAVLRNPYAVLRYALFGFLLYQVGKFLVSLLILLLYPQFSNLNDTAVMDSIAQNYTLMSIGTIILAPVVEEVLYRGVVFGCLHKRNALLGYVISTVVFSLIHIISYINLYNPIALLCSFLVYLPAGLCLAWAYDKSGNIIAPILIHIAVNQLGILYLR